MDWLFANWFILLGFVALLFVSGIAIYKFLGLPTKSQMKKIKEWLLYAVLNAESVLGSQTGVVKLRMVYDMFISRFPMVAKIISFERFKLLVDEALEEMERLLESNENIKDLIK